MKMHICWMVPFWYPGLYGTLAFDLGTAGPFGVLAGTTVTNTGPTIVDGDLGVWGGTSITGFPPGLVNGTIDDSDARMI
jgi:hypothetical protein